MKGTKIGSQKIHQNILFLKNCWRVGFPIGLNNHLIDWVVNIIKTTKLRVKKRRDAKNR